MKIITSKRFKQLIENEESRIQLENDQVNASMALQRARKENSDYAAFCVVMFIVAISCIMITLQTKKTNRILRQLA